ncbi:MAG: phosphoglycerate dehydrogenase [Candidatus Omnitrophota bacterium]
MYKILVSDALAQEGLDILKSQKNFQVDVKTKLPPDEIKKIIKDYDALVVRSATQVSADIIAAGTNLKIIGRAGVGVDNVDVEAASRQGIIVMNAPSGNTVSTAEHTISMILALSRNIPQASASLKNKKWEKSKFTGVELYGKTLGVVGVGRIGGEVAKRMRTFGMRVLAYDPYLLTERAKELGAELVELETLFKEADYITVHVPLSEQTQYMIGKEQFAMMKDGVRIINCARGGIVDEKALLEALKSKKVAGAALDVFEKEPAVDSPLLDLENVVATPHLGAATEEAQISVAIDIAKQVADALSGKGVRNAVNVPCVDPKTQEALKPYILLGEKLGMLVAQLVEGAIAEVNIRYHGDIISHDLSPVTIGIVKGMLTPVLQSSVNYVNATFLAKERGIKITELKSSQLEDFANLISVAVKAKDKTLEVWGTLFTNSELRLVKIENFHVETTPSGHMLVMHNLDKPGIIGQVGSILGANNINIAAMTFGREKAGGDAITVLNIDSPASAKVLEELKKAKNIKDAKQIKL